MKLYARRTSSNSQKVLWFLGELGLEYEFVATGGDAGGLDRPDYRAMNPNGAVPTLLDGDLAVWESHSILRYLAAMYAAERYWPADPAERSWIDRWMDWSQSGFDAAFMALFWGYWRTPEADRDGAANRVHLARCRRYMKVLDAELAGRTYLLGDRLSLTDVPVGALMFRYANLEVTDDLLPNVARWYAALTERKAFQTHVMLPFDELKGRLAP
jgi:glutathione S-transferase